MSEKIRWKKPLPKRILECITPEEKKTLVSYDKKYKKFLDAITKISSQMSEIPDKMVYNRKKDYYEFIQTKEKKKLHIEQEFYGSELWLLKDKHASYVSKLRKKYPKETQD